ncbi:MAG: hypothetical protein JST80_09095 [Bdellovibrionales bacterium]|nr:hypothetical protein [Bdellovibrionales bacterium]
MKNLSFILACLFVVTVSNAQEITKDSGSWVCEAQCNPVDVMNAGKTAGTSVKMALPNQKVAGKIKGVTKNTGEKKIEVAVPGNDDGGCTTVNLCKALGTSAVDAATKLNNLFKAEMRTIASANNGVCKNRSFSNWVCAGPNGAKTDKSVLTADADYGGSTDAKKGSQ